MQITKKKLAIVASATAVIALSGTGAMAFWTTGGSGTGSAAAGTTANITINQTTDISVANGNAFYPGGPAIALAGTFTSTNPGNVTIAGVVFDAATTSVTSGTEAGKPACSVSDFTFAGTSAANIVVPSGANTGAWSGLTVALKDTAQNQDNCKNQTLTIGYKVG